MKRKVKKEYTQLRARMLSRGLTLHAWARSRGYPVTTVYGAARGERAGVKAAKIQAELMQEVGS